MSQPGMFNTRFAAITTTASGATTIVPAVTDKKIVVKGYMLLSTGANTVTFKSNTTPITGAMDPAANGGMSYSGSADSPAFATAAGEALTLTLGQAAQVSGHVCYETR